LIGPHNDNNNNYLLKKLVDPFRYQWHRSTIMSSHTDTTVRMFGAFARLHIIREYSYQSTQINPTMISLKEYILHVKDIIYTDEYL